MPGEEERPVLAVGDLDLLLLRGMTILFLSVIVSDVMTKRIIRLQSTVYSLLPSTSGYSLLQHRRGPGYLGDGLAQGPLGTVD